MTRARLVWELVSIISNVALVSTLATVACNIAAWKDINVTQVTRAWLRTLAQLRARK